MQSGFFAEPAVLIEFKSVRVILLVFKSIVIALFALGACKSYFNSHNNTSKKITPLKRRFNNIAQYLTAVNDIASIPAIPALIAQK